MKSRVQISILLNCLVLVFLWNHLGSGSATAWGQEEPAAVEEVAADEVAEEVESDDDDFADDDDEEAAQVVQNRWGGRMPDMLGAKKLIIEQELKTELELIASVCQIDAKQQKKLGIALRGVTKKLIEQWKKELALAAGQDSLDVEATVFEDASEIDGNVLQSIQFSGNNPFKTTKVTDAKFWRKSLRTTLTKEQLAAYRDYRVEESRLRQQKLIESTVATLAFELNLNREKKQDFEKLVTPYLEQEHFTAPALYEGYVILYYASKTSKSKLKRILSKAQYQKWIIMMAPMKEIGQMMEQDQNGEMDFGQPFMDFVGRVIDTVAALADEVGEFFKSALQK